MLQNIRYVLQLFLTFAVALLAFHIQQIWYHSGLGWGEAIRVEWEMAGNIMIGAFAVVVVVGILEWLYWRKQDKESKQLQQDISEIKSIMLEIKDYFKKQ